MDWQLWILGGFVSGALVGFLLGRFVRDPQGEEDRPLAGWDDYHW